MLKVCAGVSKLIVSVTTEQENKVAANANEVKAILKEVNFIIGIVFKLNFE
jgi:predicted nucleic acid-binding Zn finger protein